MEQDLALLDEAVQIQVCSDFNFHSEEQFKLNYWTKVVLTLIRTTAEGGNKLAGVSPSSLKKWWHSNVSVRSLPGLRKVLFAAVHFAETGPSSLLALSVLKKRYEEIFEIKSDARAPSLLTRVATWTFNTLWRHFKDENEISSGGELEEEDVIFSSQQLEKATRNIFESLQLQHATLVNETDVAAAVDLFLGERQQVVPLPLANIAASDLCAVVMTQLVDICRAIPFKANDIFCLKLPLKDANASLEVTERDKAHILSRIALEKLKKREEKLTSQWKCADSKIREHLSAGRKKLALTALRERKQIEERMEEIEILKFKLAETHSVSQTALIQQAVIQAIAIGTQAVRNEPMLDPEEVSEVMEDANELKLQLGRVSLAIAPTDEEQDESLLLEYEELLAQHGPSAVDLIPSPPTQPIVATPSPQLIIPEEWIKED